MYESNGNQRNYEIIKDTDYICILKATEHNGKKRQFILIKKVNINGTTESLLDTAITMDIVVEFLNSTERTIECQRLYEIVKGYVNLMLELNKFLKSEHDELINRVSFLLNGYYVENDILDSGCGLQLNFTRDQLEYYTIEESIWTKIQTRVIDDREERKQTYNSLVIEYLGDFGISVATGLLETKEKGIQFHFNQCHSFQVMVLNQLVGYLKSGRIPMLSDILELKYKVLEKIKADSDFGGWYDQLLSVINEKGFKQLSVFLYEYLVTILQMSQTSLKLTKTDLTYIADRYGTAADRAVSIYYKDKRLFLNTVLEKEYQDYCDGVYTLIAITHYHSIQEQKECSEQVQAEIRASHKVQFDIWFKFTDEERISLFKHYQEQAIQLLENEMSQVHSEYYTNFISSCMICLDDPRFTLLIGMLSYFHKGIIRTEKVEGSSHSYNVMSGDYGGGKSNSMILEFGDGYRTRFEDISKVYRSIINSKATYMKDFYLDSYGSGFKKNSFSWSLFVYAGYRLATNKSTVEYRPLLPRSISSNVKFGGSGIDYDYVDFLPYDGCFDVRMLDLIEQMWGETVIALR